MGTNVFKSVVSPCVAKFTIFSIKGAPNNRVFYFLFISDNIGENYIYQTLGGV
jgi:hypothetical protein